MKKSQSAMVMKQFLFVPQMLKPLDVHLDHQTQTPLNHIIYLKELGKFTMHIVILIHCNKVFYVKVLSLKSYSQKNRSMFFG